MRIVITDHVLNNKEYSILLYDIYNKLLNISKKYVYVIFKLRNIGSPLILTQKILFLYRRYKFYTV